MKTGWLIWVILGLALIIRVAGLGQVPASLSWDEAASAYDAWSISQTGTDQWGQSWPLVFQSFGEYKYPIHIYLTAVFVKILGLGDVVVKLPSVLFGVAAVGGLYLLVREMTGRLNVARWAALFLAISPVSIQFSRMLWEANFSLTFLIWGSWFFWKGLRSSRWWIGAMVCWGLMLLSYNSAKIFLPLWLVVLGISYFRPLIKQPTAWIGGLILGLIVGFLVLHPQLSGINRYQQVAYTTSQVQATQLYQLTGRYKLGQLEVFVGNYLSHFNPRFMFFNGDTNLRHSTQVVGEFWPYELVLMLVGVVFLIKKPTRWGWAVLAWWLIAPIPAALVKEAPHATRSIYLMGAGQIISGLGMVVVIDWLRRYRWQRWGVGLMALVMVGWVGFFGWRYFGEYRIVSAAEYQYGYQQLFRQYGHNFSNYDQIYISDYAAQPYIFGLYELQVPAGEFRDTVVYNQPSEWGFSTVRQFDKFYFGPINPQDLSGARVLIFAEPEHRFDQPEQAVIKNLDGTVAFYIYEITQP